MVLNWLKQKKYKQYIAVQVDRKEAVYDILDFILSELLPNGAHFTSYKI